MSRTMTYEQLELNGCYAMLCEALRAWYRIQHDHIREIAAKNVEGCVRVRVPSERRRLLMEASGNRSRMGSQRDARTRIAG